MRIPKNKQGRATVAHQYSPKQEKNIAEKLGGKLVRGSGRGHEKGDVKVSGIIRVENKCTAKVNSNNPKSGFKVTLEMIEKIEDQALLNGEAPAIEVEFIDKDGKVLHEWAIVPTYILKSIVENYI